MTKIRQLKPVTATSPTDAFVIEREGEGSYYIEAQYITAPPGTLVVTQQDGTTVVAATVTMNFTGGAEVTADGTTANVRIPIQNDGTVTSVDISGGTSGLTSIGGPITSSGTLTLGGILNVANGGTGTTAPALTAGSNITLTGSWPNYTISADASSLRVDTTPITNGGSGNLLYDNSGTLGEYSLVPVSKGGTGTASPGLVAGTNVTISGSWPNQTINSSGGGGGSLTVGTTAIASGTSGYILYDNAGVLGNLATTGSGSVVQATSPVLVTPNLGTPSAATLTNATGLPLTTGTTGILTVAKGGTGTSSPSLVAGTNVTISGSWPNQTINASGGGGGGSSVTFGAPAAASNGTNTINSTVPIYLFAFAPAGTVISKVGFSSTTAATCTWYGGIYADSAGSPGSLLASSSANSNIVIGINETSVSYTFASSAFFWIALVSTANFNNPTTSSTRGSAYGASGSSTLPSPAGSTTGYSGAWSLWATT